MNKKLISPEEDQLIESLSIVELEERHELTAVGADASRCPNPDYQPTDPWDAVQ